ncbi:MAG: hypothetical protein WBW33_23290, partial [Bryobacteraceae bacterium]
CAHEKGDAPTFQGVFRATARVLSGSRTGRNRKRRPGAQGRKNRANDGASQRVAFTDSARVVDLYIVSFTC